MQNYTHVRFWTVGVFRSKSCVVGASFGMFAGSAAQLDPRGSRYRQKLPCSLLYLSFCQLNIGSQGSRTRPLTTSRWALSQTAAFLNLFCALSDFYLIIHNVVRLPLRCSLIGLYLTLRIPSLALLLFSLLHRSLDSHFFLIWDAILISFEWAIEAVEDSYFLGGFPRPRLC